MGRGDLGSEAFGEIPLSVGGDIMNLVTRARGIINGGKF